MEADFWPIVFTFVVGIIIGWIFGFFGSDVC